MSKTKELINKLEALDIEPTQENFLKYVNDLYPNGTKEIKKPNKK